MYPENTVLKQQVGTNGKGLRTSDPSFCSCLGVMAISVLQRFPVNREPIYRVPAKFVDENHHSSNEKS